MCEVGEGASRARWRAAVLGLAFAHFGLFVIGMFDRLEYTRPPQFVFLELVAGNTLWIPLHLAVATALVVTRRSHPLALSRVLSASAAAMGAWSFFTLLWGLWPTVPVALPGPILGMLVAAGAHLLSRAYLEAAMSHGEG